MAPLGVFYAWRRGDPLPAVRTPEGFTIERAAQPAMLSQVIGLHEREAARRSADGHQLWIAWTGNRAAGWGWVATRRATIGGLDISFTLPDRDRYLWDFATRPEQRGRRVYPALLQAILRTDTDGDRFWIGHDRGNDASARGIRRAGFIEVGAVHITTSGELRYVAHGPTGTAAAGAALLGLPMVESPIS